MEVPVSALESLEWEERISLVSQALASLPERNRLVIGLYYEAELTLQEIGDVLYCHASPRNDVDIFTERTPEERIAFLFEGLDVPVVVCGHTHMQFERTVAGVRVINAGSVGMPYEDEPGAYWLLDLVHRRTPYEGAQLQATREEALAEFTERGL